MMNKVKKIIIASEIFSDACYTIKELGEKG
jgi:hypothetical protein